MLNQDFVSIYRKFMEFFNHVDEIGIKESSLYKLHAYKAIMTGLLYLFSSSVRFNLSGLMYGVTSDREFIGNIALQIFTYGDLFCLASWYNTVIDDDETNEAVKELSEGSIEILLFEVADVENNYTKTLEKETKYYDIKDVLTKKFLITKIVDNKIKLFVNTGQNYVNEIKEIMEKESQDDKGTKNTTLHPKRHNNKH